MLVLCGDDNTIVKNKIVTNEVVLLEESCEFARARRGTGEILTELELPGSLGVISDTVVGVEKTCDPGKLQRL